MKITHVRKNSKGNIIEVKLDDGQELTVEEAIPLIMNKEIEDISIGHNKFGDPYLRKYPNGEDDDNLDNLPNF